MCECKCPCGCSFPSNQPGWKPLPSPHKHAAFIKAWADGAKIEYYDKLREDWFNIETPQWAEFREYRVKPTPKPDFIKNVYLSRSRYPGLEHLVTIKNEVLRNNVQCTFDGKTGKLKSVSIINS